MNDDVEIRVIASVTITPLYAIALYWIVLRSAYDKFRLRNPLVRLHYSILDIWAFTLGVTPALIYIAFGINGQTLIENNTAYSVLAQLLTLSQLSGAFLALLKNNEATDPHTFSYMQGLGPALTILLGTLAGVALLTIVPIVALVGGIAFGAVYFMMHGPLIVPLALLGYLLVWLWRNVSFRNQS